MAGASVTKRRIDEFLQLVKRFCHHCAGYTKLSGYRGELATLRALMNALMLKSRFLSEHCVGTLPPENRYLVDCPYHTYANGRPSLMPPHVAALFERMLMFYIIHALDKPGQTQTLVSGPLLDDDGETMIGSFFLVEADSKEDVIRFNAADPFARIGSWQSISIHTFNKRVDNR
jgi:uncharacterized protein YciI